jgi:hypothetical protein
MGSTGSTGFLVASPVVKEGDVMFSWKIFDSCTICSSLASKAGAIFDHDYFASDSRIDFASQGAIRTFKPSEAENNPVGVQLSMGPSTNNGHFRIAIIHEHNISRMALSHCDHMAVSRLF